MADLRGVYPPLPTPFHAQNLEVDFDALEAHVAWLRAEGVDGVLSLGTTGEFASLSFSERRDVIRFVLSKRGSLEVIVNCSATNLPEVLELARAAADGGARAALVMPPFYFRAAPRAGFIDFYRRVLDRSPLPVLLYHFVAMSGVDLGREGLAELVQHSNFVGVKDSGTKIDSILEFTAHSQLRVFVGNDHLVEDGVARGAAGAITVCSNVVPGLVRHVVGSAAMGGEPDDLQKALSRARLVVEKHGGLRAVKAILELRGIGNGVVRPPLVPLGTSEKKSLRVDYESVVNSIASMKTGHGPSGPERH
ncbi:MAG: dihydrodipicolinate synthase family protein [Planctomycetes bacterium]|nr:dihydrodipicolinate synthase family protein [Planctomycetota bacterium]MBI3845110.1 dihydrodipicolinate synthase family protein [Planctomycetota bacterium]